MADNNTIARPYAQAVFELAREAGELDAWADALHTGSRLMADGQVVALLANPAVTDVEQLGFLTGLFASAGVGLLDGSHDRGANFLKLLIENDRIDVLPEIAEHFEELKDRVEGVVEVMVTSASPLSDSQREQISAALQERLGRDVHLETELNENLIGGAVIKAGDVVIDGSLRARLEGLATALTK